MSKQLTNDIYRTKKKLELLNSEKIINKELNDLVWNKKQNKTIKLIKL